MMTTSTNHNLDKNAELAFERRQELVSKVAVLEARAEDNKEKMERFEKAFLVHTKHEEVVMREVENAMIALPNAIDLRIDRKVSGISTKVNKMSEDLIKAKTVIWVLSGIGTVIITILTYFHEPIIHWLFAH